MKKIGVAILGLGVVGGGTYRIITEHREFYQKTQDVDICVESVLELDRDRALELGVPEDKIASQIAEVVCNPDVNIVVECIGGVGLAREYVLDVLKAGKTVVSSNKELICKHWHELERIARHQNAGIYFEASCVGGVPIIRTLLDGVQANDIRSMIGIINGTTNYILTKMTEEGASYSEALAEAQRLGFAEADPCADIEGYDAAYKLSILSSIAFHTKVPFAKISREGIDKIAKEDIAYGKDLGYVVKLLAIAKKSAEGVEVRVHPAFVNQNHPLASVNDSYNAVYVTGDSVGSIMLYGRGAGALPTGSAIVSDIIFAATHAENKYSTFKNTANADKDVKFVSDYRSAYYMRLDVLDKAGVLAKLTAIFAKYGISISELIQKPYHAESGRMTLVLVTYETTEFAAKNAIAKINATELAKVETVLRVVS